MPLDAVALDALRERVIGCCIAVHRALGPGLLESIYRDCLMIELKAAGLRVEREHSVTLHYRGERVGTALRLDLLVEDMLVVEVKAVERLHPVHSAQVITYLKLSGLPAALLVNFNMTTLRAGLKKLVHPDLYKPRAEPVDHPNPDPGTADANGTQLSPDDSTEFASYPAVRRDRSEKQDSS